jgi:uncharacterized protein HemX
VDPFTIALIVSTVAGLGTSAWQGAEQKSAQRDSIRRQQAAQSQAESNAMAQQRRADEEQRKVNQKQPDLSSLLAFEQQFKPFGGAPQKPLDMGALKLSRPTLGAP